MDLRVGVAQWLATPGDVRSNLDVAVTAIEELAPDCDLITLPELWSCGYRHQTLHDDVRRTAEELDGPILTQISRLARDRKVWIAAGSVPERDGQEFFNTLVLIDDQGRIVSRHRKAHLWGEIDAIFSPGECLTVADSKWGPIGLSICFDGDFPEVARAYRSRGARLVINPAAYDHSAAGWWDILFRAHALTNSQWWVLPNQSGTTGDTSFVGRSQVIDPRGVVAAAASFTSAGAPGSLETISVDLRTYQSTTADTADPEVLFLAKRPDLPVFTGEIS